MAGGGRAALVLVSLALGLLLLISKWSGAPSVDVGELARLRHSNAALLERLARVEASQTVAAAAAATSSSASAASSASPTTAATGAAPAATLLATELLALHSHWDWRSIAFEMLQPFAYVDGGMLENAVRACYENGTMYCMRAQIRSGELYITDYRAVFFDRHYAPAVRCSSLSLTHPYTHMASHPLALPFPTPTAHHSSSRRAPPPLHPRRRHRRRRRRRATHQDHGRRTRLVTHRRQVEPPTTTHPTTPCVTTP